MAKYGKAWQSMAKHDKAWQSMTKHGKAYDSLPMTADDSLPMTGLHYIRQDKIEPNCEKFNLRTDGRTQGQVQVLSCAFVAKK